MPLPIALALVASVVALGALWVAPVVGLALFGLVVLAGLRAVPVRPRDARAVERQLHQARGGRAGRHHRVPRRPRRPQRPPGERALPERCTEDLCEMPRPITVPDGPWFLAGDNRGESDDSRFWGPVPTSAIVGIVRLRYWPLGKLGAL